MSETKPSTIHSDQELVEADLYDDLLNRYERVLVYAGELREKLRAQEQDLEDAAHLKGDLKRLEKGAAIDEAYIRFLESALKSLGILSPGPKEESPDSERSLPSHR